MGRLRDIFGGGGVLLTSLRNRDSLHEEEDSEVSQRHGTEMLSLRIEHRPWHGTVSTPAWQSSARGVPILENEPALRVRCQLVCEGGVRVGCHLARAHVRVADSD